MLRFFKVSKLLRLMQLFAYAIALTRAARRDILRAAVFLLRSDARASLLGLYLPSIWFPLLG